MLATAYYKSGDYANAVQTEKQAVELVREQNDLELQKRLESNLARFEATTGGTVRTN